MVLGLIFALALVNLLLSAYFTLAYYGRVKKSRWVPEILCAREGSSCVTVVQTPYACVFGVPNSLLGVLYCLLIMAWILGEVTGWFSSGRLSSVDLSLGGLALHFSGFIHFGLLIASFATVTLGFYLIYALRRILRIDCPLCYTAHGINAALLVLLILQAR